MLMAIVCAHFLFILLLDKNENVYNVLLLDYDLVFRWIFNNRPG